ncbi:helix-turn-helix domain-containing protein [Nocardioides sp. T2.26MG-1]|uniref:helix-turn-helix domain-containing protein n=1 Tax=Nocardioides sp. T2.26MG-1 TaxID=3041166 RepID=UPI002477926A|nr:helix-turn-helix domain-containing protein [Nocardioides sp. T2.26MG-1]CAI9409176.1 hypothetical protein HIDPHFAB_01234 [Nocardioides sp. T2.26MG-1]
MTRTDQTPMPFAKPQPRRDDDSDTDRTITEPADPRAVDRWTWERTVKQRARGVKMPPTAQHIGLLIATYCDAQTGGNAYPSVATLVESSGRSKDTVHTALRWLRTGGWLHQVSQGSGGSGKSSEYQLTVPRV